MKEVKRLEPLRILVVDDNDGIRESLKLILESLGHEVIVVKNGEDGIGLIVQIHPEVVIADFSMPGKKSGADVIAHVKAFFPKIKAILMSGESVEGIAEEVGADKFLLKPEGLTIASIEQTLCELCE